MTPCKLLVNPCWTTFSVDELQVVESSLSWTPDLEHEEQSSQVSLHRKGCTAVLVALAELRKISITLQHM
jgi:hypothetical protein